MLETDFNPATRFIWVVILIANLIWISTFVGRNIAILLIELGFGTYFKGELRVCSDIGILRRQIIPLCLFWLLVYY